MSALPKEAGGGHENDGDAKKKQYEGGEGKKLSACPTTLKPADSTNISANRGSTGLDMLALIASSVPAAASASCVPVGDRIGTREHGERGRIAANAGTIDDHIDDPFAEHFCRW